MLEVHSSAFEDGAPLPLRFASPRVGRFRPLPAAVVDRRTRGHGVPRHHVRGPRPRRARVAALDRRRPSARPAVPGRGRERQRDDAGGARELTGTAGVARICRGRRRPRAAGPHPYEFTVWALDAGSRFPSPRTPAWPASSRPPRVTSSARARSPGSSSARPPAALLPTRRRRPATTDPEERAMDIITREDIRRLAETEHTGPVVSIYLPTHPVTHRSATRTWSCTRTSSRRWRRACWPEACAPPT